MGAKGRDIALYLFFISAALGITGSLINLPVIPFFCIATVTGIMSLYYYVYIFRARKQSRKMGLKCVVLLPLSYGLVQLLLHITDRKIRGGYRHAFEIHIEAPTGLTLGDFLKMLESDLNLMKVKMAGSLFAWETSAPVPASMRRLIKQKTKEGKAFWEKGGWPIPSFPFTGRNIKKDKLRRGFLLNE